MIGKLQNYQIERKVYFRGNKLEEKGVYSVNRQIERLGTGRITFMFQGELLEIIIL